MAIKKEETMLVQTRIPVSFGRVLEARAAEEMCSMADLLRRALALMESMRAPKNKKKRRSRK